MNDVDFKTRNFNHPYYVWFGQKESYRVMSYQNNQVVLQPGHFLAPIPLYIRKNKSIDLYALYPEYASLKLNNLPYLDAIRSRKDSSEIVAWNPTLPLITISYDTMIQNIKQYIDEQEWTCRYCGTINYGGYECQGISTNTFPIGGPQKSNNNVLVEYNYFLAKSNCMPIIVPECSWISNMSTNQPTRCGAIRCVHFQHTNQSDQILSFPRQAFFPTKGILYNTPRFYLPGAMLGHQITKQEHQCTKCRTILTLPKEINTLQHNIEHAWWIMEIIYWFKVDIYNKKMQKLPPIQAKKRYQDLLHDIHQLYQSNVPDFIFYHTKGQYQTTTFQNLLKPLISWLSKPDNYFKRFEK